MQRFFDKICISETGCWNWIAAIRNPTGGYGCIKFRGKIVDAHRVSWIIHKGEIPEGLLVCHTCDNRKCVNPAHLFLGTQRDNMQDCLDKGRLVTPEGFRFQDGFKPPNRTLKEEEIEKVKSAIFGRGGKTLKEVAKELGIKYQLVRDINSQRTYK